MNTVDIKRDLPDIDVKLHAGILKGQLSGRLNAFATVTVRSNDTDPPIRFECAWVTIADCLERGIAIKA